MVSRSSTTEPRYEETTESSTVALRDLGKALRARGYEFVTVSPETQRRVEARAVEAGRAEARSLRDVFGWSRPFEPALLPGELLSLGQAAGVFVEEGRRLRSRVRFSSLRDQLFVHSAYPTVAESDVFFGPDTHRFCDLIRSQSRPARRVVDVGCGSGAGGILCAANAERVVLADINAVALRFAEVNAALSGVLEKTEIVESDVLSGVSGDVDMIVANPPFMRDGAGRTYRDGGGRLGADLAVRIVRESLSRLEPGGRLVLYTGAAFVDGVDTFLSDVRPVCVEAAASWEYHEIDPDIFGEEIEQNPAYSNVERIAAVALLARAR